MAAIVSTIDVGQGDCTVAVDDQSGLALIIDCNARHHEAAIAELDARGFSELRSAIVSHSHRDHFGGVLDVLEAIGERFTGTLYLNHDTLLAMPPPVGETEQDAKNILRSLFIRAREYSGRVKPAYVDAVESVGSMTWRLVAPTYDQLLDAVAAGNPNLGSGIVVIEVGRSALTIGGDAQLSAWEKAADRIAPGSIVRWPHHGGRVGASDDAQARLMSILQPTAVIVSVGASNSHGHPQEAFFDAAAERRLRLLCTQATPSCARGGTGGVCAGTVRVRLDESKPPTIEPDTPNHDVVIAGWGSAQCLR